MIEATSKDILAQAQAALKASPIHDLRDLRVERDGELLTIQGRVNSFYHKQMAQETLREVVDESMRLVNSIVVD